MQLNFSGNSFDLSLEMQIFPVYFSLCILALQILAKSADI